MTVDSSEAIQVRRPDDLGLDQDSVLGSDVIVSFVTAQATDPPSP
jgi:hypothetical protein